MLPALPRGANGKIDRAALPDPDASEVERPPFEAPRTPTEEAVAALFCDLLGQEVGIHDNFFAVGGDSLRAGELIGRIRWQFGIEISIRVVFERPTVADLSDEVEELLLAQLEAEG